MVNIMHSIDHNKIQLTTVQIVPLILFDLNEYNNVFLISVLTQIYRYIYSMLAIPKFIGIDLIMGKLFIKGLFGSLELNSF
jgi:hypothetical protein